MENSDLSAALIKKAEELTDRLDTVAKNQASLKGDVRRRTIFGAVVIVIDILLTVGLGISIPTAFNAINTANTNRSSQVATCQSSNVARKVNHDLWTYALSQIASPNPTPAEQAGIAAFQNKVDSAFAPKDCAAIK